MSKLKSCQCVCLFLMFNVCKKMIKTKKIMYVKPFYGLPELNNFELVEEELPMLQENEILCEAEFHSVDPYQRAYMSRYPLGSIMIGRQIAKVTKSNHLKYPIDSYIFGDFGWRTHTIINPDMQDKMNFYLLPSVGNHPKSIGLGHLGRTGNTAYFGFLEICQPKSGETVVVTGAGGAVGSLVGQIAKIKGCAVIGFAGTDDKCDWIVKELGFDHALNYKKGNIEEALKKVAPNGIDCYFDNVGGKLSAIIISQMKTFGRISVCGSISAYNDQPNDSLKDFHMQRSFVWQQLKMEGFLVHRFKDRWFEGIEQIHKWIDEGKIKYQETITEGFEQLPIAFREMLEGKNYGKAIVKSKC